MKNYLKLTFVTNRLNRDYHEYLSLISTCVKYGVTSVQLREKNPDTETSLQFGKRLMEFLKPLDVPLIVNDSLALCLKLKADGLHLGQSDGDVEKARKLLGSSKIIGLTIENEEQLEHANNLPAGCINYIGIGSIYPSKTKPDNPIVGIEGLKKFAKFSKYPIVAIGGIKEKNIISVMKAGAKGIAAIGAFHDGLCPKTETEKLCSLIESVQQNNMNFWKSQKKINSVIPKEALYHVKTY